MILPHPSVPPPGLPLLFLPFCVYIPACEKKDSHWDLPSPGDSHLIPTLLRPHPPLPFVVSSPYLTAPCLPACGTFVAWRLCPCLPAPILPPFHPTPLFTLQLIGFSHAFTPACLTYLYLFCACNPFHLPCPPCLCPSPLGPCTTPNPSLGSCALWLCLLCLILHTGLCLNLTPPYPIAISLEAACAFPPRLW